MPDIKVEIIFPIFLECCKYCPDLFWVNVFEELSYGKTPYGVYISKKYLCCNYKNKEFSYKIENTDSKKLYTDIYELLSKKLGLLSTQEKLKKRLDFNTAEDSIKESKQNWNSIRKKNVKDLLIEKYVLRMKKKYSLKFKQARYLLSLIYITMVFKIITQKDIIYCDGVIDRIEGIDFEKNKIILSRELYNVDDQSFAPQIFIEKKSMSECWDKYLKELKKMQL
jgi:hypothetical protein